MGTRGKRESRAITAGALSLLVAIAGLTLAACGGSGATASASPSTTPSDAVTPTAPHEVEVFQDVRYMSERD